MLESLSSWRNVGNPHSLEMLNWQNHGCRMIGKIVATHLALHLIAISCLVECVAYSVLNFIETDQREKQIYAQLAVESTNDFYRSINNIFFYNPYTNRLSNALNPSGLSQFLRIDRETAPQTPVSQGAKFIRDGVIGCFPEEDQEDFKKLFGEGEPEIFILLLARALYLYAYEKPYSSMNIPSFLLSQQLASDEIHPQVLWIMTARFEQERRSLDEAERSQLKEALSVRNFIPTAFDEEEGGQFEEDLSVRNSPSERCSPQVRDHLQALKVAANSGLQGSLLITQCAAEFMRNPG